MMRTPFLLTLCVSATTPLFSTAKNLGVHGPTFAIEEKNLLEVIQAKLQDLQKQGEIAAINTQIIEKVKHSALNPTPLHLPTATEYKARVFDPTYVVQKDITDHQGQMIAKAGTKVNPLDHFQWGTPILLINGEDPDQISLAKTMKAKLVLVKGSPFRISKEETRPENKPENRQMYFDQGGRIVKHFGITRVPSKISQQGTVLLIEEIPPITPGAKQ